jgi:hypothetical protein
MSHAALAAVLRLDQVSAGERLTAFSLASFANREHRAWPSTPVAAARTGLSRSQYLAARDGLARRGLVDVDASGGGRGRSAMIRLRFAELGPWADIEVNPRLVEAVLTHSRTRGSVRVLLVTLAAVADDHGAVDELSTQELQAAAGMADSTYRRARATLLESGELVLAAAGGGRARTNRWIVADPRTINPTPLTATRQRPAPKARARPLLASTRPRLTGDEQLDLLPETETAEARADVHDQVDPVAVVSNPAQTRTVSPRNGPGSSGVTDLNPAQTRTVPGEKGPRLTGVSARNPGQNQTVCRETPPQTPSKTPPPSARAGKEPQNPGTRKRPPDPPAGGHHEAASIVEDYLTPRGRRRQRTVTVDLEEARSRLLFPAATDRADWQHIRGELESAVGAEMFAIWLAPLQLVGCDPDGVLLLACPAETRPWVCGRYSALLERISTPHGRRTRLATELESQLLAALRAAPAPQLDMTLRHEHQEAV